MISALRSRFIPSRTFSAKKDAERQSEAHSRCREGSRSTALDHWDAFATGPVHTFRSVVLRIRVTSAEEVGHSFFDAYKRQTFVRAFDRQMCARRLVLVGCPVVSRPNLEVLGRVCDSKSGCVFCLARYILN